MRELHSSESIGRLGLGNLFSLWESVGAANGSLEIHDGFRRIYHHGSSWPNRLWLSEGQGPESARATLREARDHLTERDRPILLVLTEEQTAICGDWLAAERFSPVFSQTAMALDLKEREETLAAGDLEVREVITPDEATLWGRCASEAFGYAVDPVVVRNAAASPGITFCLGYLSDEVAGTGLLCTHRGVAGFHMAGTRSRYRRRGVARQMMHHLLGKARRAGLDYGTLQASAMGEPLYLQMGFRKQFTLCNYGFSESPSHLAQPHRID